MPEHTEPCADHLNNLCEFETVLADISSGFINLNPDQVDREIEDSLRRVCEHLSIDFAVLWQWSTRESGIITPTHFFPTREPDEPSNPPLQDQYPWVVEQILAGHTISITSLEELPPEAAVDRESARLSGIKSNLCLPLTVGGGPRVGVLAFNTLQEEHDWPEILVLRLQLVAEVFTNALVRRRNDLILKESEERLSLAADSAEAGLWAMNLATGIFWANQKGRAIFGFSPDDVVSIERFEASIHPDDRRLVRDAIERSTDTGEPINEEYRIIVPGDDTVRWIASRGRLQFAPSGEPERLTGVSIDVSERKRAEEDFRASEARLAAGAELAGLAFYEVDFGEGTMYVDDRIRDLCGVPPTLEQDLQVLDFWLEHLHPDDRQYVLDRRDQLHSGKADRLSLEYRYLHPERGEMWMHHLAGTTTRDATGRAIRTFGVFRDITESKLAEDALHDLSQRLIRAHEEERALLARELHDDVTQRLAVLAIDVGRIEFAVPDGPQAEAMRSIREGLVCLSEDVHSLAYQLHPSVLDELGLTEALRTECERRGRQSRLELSVEIEPVPTAVVGKDAALCLFRVAQEALNNISRHANAHIASVTLEQVDDGVMLAVRDDGVGFDPATSRRQRHLGLASMRERVSLAKGTLDIESKPGTGTTVAAWIPCLGGSR